MKYEEIKRLIDDMGNSKIDSLKIEFPDGVKISMEKNEKQVITNIPQIQQVPILENKEKQKENVECNHVVSSPMVGTFYESASPTAEPFVKVGDKVKKGQVLCIVEAMKLMNEIESDADGEIVEVCAKNGKMVEYNAPLFKLK